MKKRLYTCIDSLEANIRVLWDNAAWFGCKHSWRGESLAVNKGNFYEVENRYIIHGSEYTV